MVENKFIEAMQSLSASGVIEYKENVLLSDISTFKIGGPCRIIIYPKNSYGLRCAVETAIETGTPYAVFGRCSNVLFADKGWNGALIVTREMKSISRKGTSITAECGVMLGDLANFAKASGLSGLEFAYGIPGTVGGAVYMNAGAYEHSVSELITSCTYYSVKDKKVMTCLSHEMDFGYRKSVFMEDGDRIILEATFEFPEKKPQGEIKAKMEEYMSKRREKQPLGYPSAGSVFKRCQGHFTGKLIEDAGLKGRMAGGAMVSTKHAGFIINYDNAKAADVLYLIDMIKKIIAEKNNVELECEVIYFGDK